MEKSSFHNYKTISFRYRVIDTGFDQLHNQVKIPFYDTNTNSFAQQSNLFECWMYSVRSVFLDSFPTYFMEEIRRMFTIYG